MGSGYWIGVSAGLGAALAVLFVGLLGTLRAGDWIALIGADIGVGLFGRWVAEWPGFVAGIFAATACGLAAGRTVRGALAGGGTRGGVSLLVVLGALALAAVSFVPVAGYLVPLVVVGILARARRRQPERFAGLRTLARD